MNKTPMKGIVGPGTLVFGKELFEFGEYSKNKYVATVVLDKGDPTFDAFAAERAARHDEAGGRDDHCPVKDGDLNVYRKGDKKGEVKEWCAGKWIVKAKTSKPVNVYDGAGKRLDTRVDANKPWSGDTVKLAWGENVQTEDGKWNGVALYCNGIQIIEKNAGMDPGFEAVEGAYQGEDYAPAAAATEGDDNGGDF